jgi:hypothetical protein
MSSLPAVLRLGPIVQLSPEAAWALWQLGTAGAAYLTANTAAPLSPFARFVLTELADAARHRDSDCRCGRQGDTSDEPFRASSRRVVSTTEAAEFLGLSSRSVQRKRHEIGGFRRTNSGLEFDVAAVQAYKRMRDQQRKEQDR